MESGTIVANTASLEARDPLDVKPPLKQLIVPTVVLSARGK
jgi:hypothetical protein